MSHYKKPSLPLLDRRGGGSPYPGIHLYNQRLITRLNDAGDMEYFIPMNWIEWAPTGVWIPSIRCSHFDPECNSWIRPNRSDRPGIARMDVEGIEESDDESSTSSQDATGVETGAEEDSLGESDAAAGSSYNDEESWINEDDETFDPADGYSDVIESNSSIASHED